MPLTETEKDLRHVRSYLRRLTTSVSKFLTAIDTTMKCPESHARGAQIAKLCNALEIEKDIVQRYGLNRPKCSSLPHAKRRDRRRVNKRVVGEPSQPDATGGAGGPVPVE